MSGGRIVVVTGTSTDVGKTIVTAALATQAMQAGRDVLVVKPLQTGAASDPGDAATISRLTGCATETFLSLDEPLAPDTAARRAGISLPPVADHAARIRQLADTHDPVIVEGAGGLLVRLDTDGGTLLDLAAELATTHPVELIVVVAAGLGTLNHAELTVAAARSRDLEPAGLVIGSWPAAPDLAESCNRTDLPRVTGLPLLGVIPAGAGALAAEEFRAQAPAWLDVQP